MEFSADVSMQESEGNAQPLMQPPMPPPMQPPVQPALSSSNTLPKKDFIPRYNARHKKPVVTQMCEICNIELIGQVVIDAHMKGSKHAKKLKARELLTNLIFKCEVCNVTLNSSQQLEVHNAGAKHIAKAKESTDPQTPGSAETQSNEPDPNTASDALGSGVQAEQPKAVVNPLHLFCTVCNVTVNSPQQLEQHLSSKKHKDREAGRAPQRPGPYQRAGQGQGGQGQGGRGGRGGLGSHGPPGRGAKSASGKYTSLSSSFTSAGYSNSFIKPEGGVILPSNRGTNKGPNGGQPHAPPHGIKAYNMGNQFKNRGNFGSLTPYISTDSGRGGYGAPPPPPPPPPHGGGDPNAPHAAWADHSQMYGGYYDYGYAGYNYSGYENAQSYADYGMSMQPPGPPPGPPPSYT